MTSSDCEYMNKILILVLVAMFVTSPLLIVDLNSYNSDSFLIIFVDFHTTENSLHIN